MATNSFPARIWQTLSAVNCNEHVEKKQNLSYLSWAWAWGILMEHFPASTYEFEGPHMFPDGTGEIWVTVTVNEEDKSWAQSMWLPILDYKNQPVKNPNAFQINSTRMRVLTKCLAMFGLGHYIYAGEDLPQEREPEAVEQEAPKRKSTSVASAVLEGVTINEESLVYPEEILRRVLTDVGDEAMQHQEGREMIEDAVRKLDGDHKVALWKRFDSKERRMLKEIGGV